MKKKRVDNDKGEDDQFQLLATRYMYKNTQLPNVHIYKSVHVYKPHIIHIYTHASKLCLKYIFYKCSQIVYLIALKDVYIR